MVVAVATDAARADPPASGRRSKPKSRVGPRLDRPSTAGGDDVGGQGHHVDKPHMGMERAGDEKREQAVGRHRRRSRNAFDRLPESVLASILSHLSCVALRKAAMLVSRRWYRTVTRHVFTRLPPCMGSKTTAIVAMTMDVNVSTGRDAGNAVGTSDDSTKGSRIRSLSTPAAPVASTIAAHQGPGPNGNQSRAPTPSSDARVVHVCPRPGSACTPAQRPRARPTVLCLDKAAQPDACAKGARAPATFVHDPQCPVYVHACSEAASCRNLEALVLLSSERHPWDASVLRAAAGSRRRTDIVLYLLDHGCPTDATVLCAAAVAGNLDTIKALLERACPRDETATRAAAGAGHVGALRLLCASGCPYTMGACHAAAARGHVSCLTFLHDLGCAWNERTCYVAAKHGHLTCLTYAIGNGCPHQLDHCLVAAIGGGHGDVVEWLLSGRTHAWDASKAYRAAARQKGAHMARLLRGHGMPWHELVTFWAACANNVECLEFAHTHGCPWHPDTCIEAAARGHFESLSYAHQNGCLAEAPKDAGMLCAMAAEGGHLHCLVYAHRNGIPWTREVCAAAILTDNPFMFRYAHENGCPCDPSECRRLAAKSPRPQAFVCTRDDRRAGASDGAGRTAADKGNGDDLWTHAHRRRRRSGAPSDPDVRTPAGACTGGSDGGSNSADDRKRQLDQQRQLQYYVQARSFLDYCYAKRTRDDSDTDKRVCTNIRTSRSVPDLVTLPATTPTLTTTTTMTTVSVASPNPLYNGATPNAPDIVVPLVAQRRHRERAGCIVV